MTRSSCFTGPALVASLVVATLAACGSPPPVSPVPGVSSAPPSPSVPPPAVTASASATPPSQTAKPPPGLGNNTPIRPSALLADVQKLGVDTTKPFAAMSIKQKKQLMKLFNKALGFESCNGCHAGDDYEKATRNKDITRKMWDTFLAPLRDQQGGALFCDSCHSGKSKPLDRSAMEGLQRVMETDYQGKLTRADKQPHDCSTCHGKGPEPKIIEKLWGIAAK